MLNAKNSAKISKNSKILIGLTAFLTILYFLSFTKSCSSSDKREKVKTALVNQKYKPEDITDICNLWLDVIEEQVSGRPRVYIDNTRAVFEHDRNQKPEKNEDVQ